QTDIRQAIVGPGRQGRGKGRLHAHRYTFLGEELASAAAPTIALAALVTALSAALSPGRGQCLSEIETVVTPFSWAGWLKFRLSICMSISVVRPATSGTPEISEEASGNVFERSAIISRPSRVIGPIGPSSAAWICTVRVILLVDWLLPLSP